MTNKDKVKQIINEMKEGIIYTIHDYVNGTDFLCHYWYEDGSFHYSYEDRFHEEIEMETSEERVISDLEMMIANTSRYKIWGPD